MEKQVYITEEEQAKGTPLLEKGYKGVFESLSKEKQLELIGQKIDFAKAAGIKL